MSEFRSKRPFCVYNRRFLLAAKALFVFLEDEMMKAERDVDGSGGVGPQPNIHIFCCQCAGGGAALDYAEPEDVDFQLVPCAGKIDPQRLLKSMEGGADGVVIVGCPPGECKMAEGNLRASRRSGYVRGILDEIGVGGDRIEIVLPEAGQEALVGAIADAVTKIKSLGPSALNLV
jgi:F420-non-reducing hydrogenase iron-sulfur subunit